MASTAARAHGNAPTAGAQARVPEQDPLTVRALARGLSILALYDVDHREWTIDEIAAGTGLLRMTAYRMVRTLEAGQFLVRDTATNRYHLGPAAITMAYVAEDHSEFTEHARPFLERLLETTGESVTLAVPVDGSPVCVSIIDSTRPFQREIAPGRIIGDLASVHGKIFTAFATPERRAAVLAQTRRRHTPYTVTDPKSFGRARASRPKRTWPSTCRACTPASARSARRSATSSATWSRPCPWSCPRAASARASVSSARGPSRKPRLHSPPISDGTRRRPLAGLHD